MRIKKNKEPGTIETKRSDWADLEIPLGKRTRKYRMLEILPGALSYTMILLLFVLSFISPIVGSYYLLFKGIMRQNEQTRSIGIRGLRI